MKILSTASVNKLIHFLYPSVCLHCEGSLEKKSHLLCTACFDLMEWIQPVGRCTYCAGPSPCTPCKRSTRPLRPHLSLFESCGPILSLYHHFLKTKQSETLASFLLIALSRSTLPLPQVVVPSTFKLFPKKEPAYLIARCLARLLKCPLELPGPSLRDQSILFVTPILKNTKEQLESIRSLKGYFPKKIVSIALIDERD